MLAPDLIHYELNRFCDSVHQMLIIQATVTHLLDGHIAYICQYSHILEVLACKPPLPPSHLEYCFWLIKLQTFGLKISLPVLRQRWHAQRTRTRNLYGRRHLITPVSVVELVLPHQIASRIRGGENAGPCRNDELWPSGTPRRHEVAIAPPLDRTCSPCKPISHAWAWNLVTVATSWGHLDSLCSGQQKKKLAAWEMQVEDFLWKNLCLATGSECNQYAKPITPISILVVSVSMQGVPCGFCTRENVEIIPILLLLCTIPHMLEVHNLLPTVGKQNWRRNRKKGFMSQSCTWCYVTIFANCDWKNGYSILSDLQTPSSLQHKIGSKPITPLGGLVLG